MNTNTYVITRPPGRGLLRAAGILTQLCCASCLLFGTIAFVLVTQNRTGGAGLVIAWAVVALVGLVLGGRVTRGGLISLVGAAAIDAAFGVALLALPYDALRALLQVLPASDVDAIASLSTGAGIAMLVVGALCGAAIPQATRYTRWLHEAMEPSPPTVTSPGFPPPPIAATRTSVWHAPAAPPRERRSRRRIYLALAGLALGVGAGVGVLVSAGTSSPRAATGGGSGGSPGARGAGPDPGGAASAALAMPPDAAEVAVEPPPPPPPPPIRTLLDAQRAALSAGDFAALAATLAPNAFSIGVSADAIAEGRDAIAAAMRRDLGELPPDQVIVESKLEEIGQRGNHAWIAQELEIDVLGRGARRYAVTQLAAALDGTWQVIAWHWAIPIPNDTAERLAALDGLAAPAPLAGVVDGPPELVAAVRAAFASRRAFAEARSDDPRGFNFGSAPGERIVGGARVRKVFERLSAAIRARDGMRIVGGGAWDPAQRAAPEIAYVAANVDFTAKSRAATELTQTFRVLGVLVHEAGGWRIVQTQWSHAAPAR
ncbi:MAG: nuclear transport factor 2 family protein [Kofleriaceae bacterium]